MSRRRPFPVHILVFLAPAVLIYTLFMIYPLFDSLWLDNLFAPEQMEVDTAGLMLMRLSNGVQASIDCSWSRPAWYPRWGHLKLDVVGERGAAVMDSFAEHVTLYSRDAPRNPSWIGFGSDPNQAMIEEFVNSIRDRREPSVNWNDGYQALRVAVAAYESAANQLPVRLEHGSASCGKEASKGQKTLFP